jgi:hypothetical protein
MMRLRLIGMLAATLATTASAQTRTTIAVAFRLQERLYRLEYKPADVQQLEAVLADSIASILSRRIPFVQFSRALPAPRTLLMTLDRKDRVSVAQNQETGFYLQLVQDGAPSTSQYWRTFRPERDYLMARGSVSAFRNELQARFEISEVESIQDLLRGIPIATEATLWTDALQGLGWILPFKRQDLCMGEETTLRVANTIRSSIETKKDFRAQARGVFNPTVVPPGLQSSRGNVMGMATDAGTDLDVLRNAPPSAITVIGVYVDRYQRSGCEAPVSPGAASFPAPGRSLP